MKRRVLFLTVLCIGLALSLSACGKRPNLLEVPTTKSPVSRGYPPYEEPPGQKT